MVDNGAQDVAIDFSKEMIQNVNQDTASPLQR